MQVFNYGIPFTSTPFAAEMCVTTNKHAENYSTNKIATWMLEIIARHLNMVREVVNMNVLIISIVNYRPP
jgi:hypothetical protein